MTRDNDKPVSRQDALREVMELLPCPFCGGERAELHNTHSASFWVECPDCDARASGEAFDGPRRKTRFSYEHNPRGKLEANYEGLHPEYRKAADSAIAAWNRRTGPALLSGGGDAEDAARWRALIGTGRVRYLGSAGLHTDTDPYGNPWNGYAHIGLELWTKHDAPNDPEAVRLLTKYADIAVAMSTTPEPTQ